MLIETTKEMLAEYLDLPPFKVDGMILEYITERVAGRRKQY
ncbi:MAG: hypothetical protein N3G75_02515 [Methanothrix sp.]|nr:hypothetical protein [Methanothrix sp.]MCX8206689.1 hypothetical protein [Methanothrix sp.]